MTIWKLASAYLIPALILAALLCGHFISQLGLLEKWFFGENEIRQIVSPLPVAAPSRNVNLEKVVVTPRKLANNEAPRVNRNGFASSANKNDKEQKARAADSLQTAFRTAKAYFNFALAQARTGRLEEAAQAYQKALRYKRDFPQASLNLGVLYYRRKDWQNARAAFEAATLGDDKYAKAYFNLALTYGKLGEYDKAVRAARQTLALNNRNAAAYNLLGMMHTLQGDYEAAVSVYKQGLAVNAKDVELLSNLSLAYQRMNQMNQAEEDLL